MSKLVMEEKLVGEFVDFLKDEKKISLDLDSSDYDDVEAVSELCSGFLEFIAAKLGEIKSKEEPSSIEVPGLLTAEVSYREGSGKEGNWGTLLTAGEEFKKYIKLKDSDSSEDDDEEDEE